MSLTEEQLIDLADTGTVVVDASGNEATIICEEGYYSPWNMDVPWFYVAWAEGGDPDDLNLAITDFGPFRRKE